LGAAVSAEGFDFAVGAILGGCLLGIVLVFASLFLAPGHTTWREVADDGSCATACRGRDSIVLSYGTNSGDTCWCAPGRGVRP